jgi:putative endonuclease
MLAAEAHPDRSAASKAEYRIKRLTAAAKRAYAATMTPDPLAPDPLAPDPASAGPAAAP